MTSDQGWEPEIAELRRREALARQMGGPENVAHEHEGTRLGPKRRRMRP